MVQSDLKADEIMYDRHGGEPYQLVANVGKKQPKQIHVGTFGLSHSDERYEDLATKSKGRLIPEQKTLEELIKVDCGGNWKRFSFGKEEHKRCLARRYFAENPRYQDCSVLIVNCLDMEDPDHDRNLSRHTGDHPSTLMFAANNLTNRQLRIIARSLRQWEASGEEEDILILCICKQERHRSIAVATLLEYSLCDKDGHFDFKTHRIAPSPRSSLIGIADGPICSTEA